MSPQQPTESFSLAQHTQTQTHAHKPTLHSGPTDETGEHQQLSYTTVSWSSQMAVRMAAHAIFDATVTHFLMLASLEIYRTSSCCRSRQKVLPRLFFLFVVSPTDKIRQKHKTCDFYVLFVFFSSSDDDNDENEFDETSSNARPFGTSTQTVLVSNTCRYS